MPTRVAALQAWLEGLGMPAYSAQGVPKGAELPYLTFTPVSGAWGDGEQAVTVGLWMRTESEAKANAAAEAAKTGRTQAEVVTAIVRDALRGE